MELTELMTLIGANSPSMAFGLLCLWLLNRDKADALRRERENADAHRADKRDLLDLQRQMTGAITELNRNIHELKNAMQRIMFDADKRRLERE